MNTEMNETTVMKAELSSELYSQFDNLVQTLNMLKTQINNITSEVKQLEKNVKKEMKIVQKESSKKKKKGGNKSPSGFAKPCKISNDLCKFLGKEEGTEMARTEVTKHIISYIDTHDLKKKENKRQIEMDDNLKKLLDVEEGGQLTYFNIQKYMNKHFLKA